MNRKIALLLAAASLSLPIGAVVAGSPAGAATRTHATVSVDKQHKETLDPSKDTTPEGSSKDASKDTSSKDTSSKDSTKDVSTTDVPSADSSPSAVNVGR